MCAAIENVVEWHRRVLHTREFNMSTYVLSIIPGLVVAGWILCGPSIGGSTALVSNDPITSLPAAPRAPQEPGHAGRLQAEPPPAVSWLQGVRPHASMMVRCGCEESVLVMMTAGTLRGLWVGCDPGVPSDGQAGDGCAGQERGGGAGFHGVAWEGATLGNVLGRSGPVCRWPVDGVLCTAAERHTALPRR